MSRFIYSIYDIFSSDPQNGCLGQNNVSGFFIDVYQRGYKWDSEINNGESHLPVNTMLRDICDAYEKDPDSTYVLQFITVKKSFWEGHGYLEVIDGQQRLTTLSILFSVFIRIKDTFQDFVKRKICYSLENTGSSLLNDFHEHYLNDYPSAEEKNDQTAWFMRKAREALYSLLKDKDDEELKKLYDYISGKVLLIVNQVEENLCGEDIFENLNSWKVFLTNVELIKGLMLCKAVRVDTQASYKELSERRTHLGRQWDEIQRCFHNPEFGAFFSENKDNAFYDFLLLVLNHSKNLLREEVKKLYDASDEEKMTRKKHYCLFNKYYSLLKNASDTHRVFQKMLELFWRMHDTYTDTRRHNLVGFMLFFNRGFDKFTTLEEILPLGESSLMPMLQKYFREAKDKLSNAASFIQSYDYSYLNQPQNIRKDLLLVNCFNIIPDGGGKKLIPNQNRKFPFYLVEPGNVDRQGKMRSLEHIHPQTPPRFDEDDFNISEKPDLTIYLSYEMAKELSMDLTMFSSEDIDLAKKYEADTSCEFESEALKKLYQFYSNITQKYHEEFEKEIPGKHVSFLHSIGNLVLLLDCQNSAEGNHNFAGKRQILRSRINKGEMVPDHTFDVFSKIGCKHSKTLNCWTTQDILDNAEYTLTEIYERLAVI